MRSKIKHILKSSNYIVLSALLALATTTLCACGSHSREDAAISLLAYQVEGNSLLARNAPTFVVERPEARWNQIASPVISRENGDTRVVLDSDIAAVYSETRQWSGQKGRYLNLIYRVHFTKIPYSLIPFTLSAGKNVGLLVIITLNSKQHPLLVTTVHTCGCYLAFIPTSFLSRESWPDNWRPDGQTVYGETLPGVLEVTQGLSQAPLALVLRDSTHRVKDLYLLDENDLTTQQAYLMPMESLKRVYSEDGVTFSFYETRGARKDYVIESRKIWERLLISWWALDWRVGEDKRLGADTSDGIVFYTSLKPWARNESDLRDFAEFLNYWGWKL